MHCSRSQVFSIPLLCQLMVKFWAYFDHIHFIKVYKNVCLNTKNLGKQDTFYLYCWHENTSYPKPGLFNDTIRVGMQCSRGHTTGRTELRFLTLITKRRSAKYPCRLGNVFHSPQELQNVQTFCPDIRMNGPAPTRGRHDHVANTI